jgi:hypothetical protein
MLPIEGLLKDTLKDTLKLREISRKAIKSLQVTLPDIENWADFTSEVTAFIRQVGR